MTKSRENDDIMRALVREGTHARRIPKEHMINTEILLRRKAVQWKSKKRFMLFHYKPALAAFIGIVVSGLAFWGIESLLLQPEPIDGLFISSAQGDAVLNSKSKVTESYNIKERDVVSTGANEAVSMKRADDLFLRLFPESSLAFVRYSKAGASFDFELREGSLYVNKSFSSHAGEFTTVRILGYTFQLTGTRVYFTLSRTNEITVSCYDGEVRVVKDSLQLCTIRKEEEIIIRSDGSWEIRERINTGNGGWESDLESEVMSGTGETVNDSVSETGKNKESAVRQAEGTSQPEKNETKTSFSTTAPDRDVSPTPILNEEETRDENVLPAYKSDLEKSEVAALDTDIEFRNGFYRKIAKLDMKTAEYKDVVSVFGEPLLYSMEGSKLDKNLLPADFIMNYPDRFSVYLHNGKIRMLSYQNPGYTFTGGLQIGASMEEVFRVMGLPVKSMTGASHGEENRVFYTDIDGKTGKGRYMNSAIGMIAIFQDEKLVEMMILAGK